MGSRTYPLKKMKMKTTKFQTSTNDEWLVCCNQIMYRCQDGMYNDDIQWENTTLAKAVKAILDAKYPRLPDPCAIEQLKGTELGELISQHLEGKLIFVPISMFEEWEQKISDLHDKLIQLGELPDGLAICEEKVKSQKHTTAWHLTLEIFCQQIINLPDRCWVEIEKTDGKLEVIEVINRKPQYRAIQVITKPGINFEKSINFEEE